jgi:hypothetical protein
VLPPLLLAERSEDPRPGVCFEPLEVRVGGPDELRQRLGQPPQVVLGQVRLGKDFLQMLQGGRTLTSEEWSSWLKPDPRVAAMLSSRRDVFPDYSLEGLKAAFSVDWSWVAEEEIDDSKRTLLHFARR